MANCGQPVPKSTKWVLTLIFCVIVIRNCLNTKHSLHYSAYFTFLSILVNLLLTGNDMCHSQPKPQHFIISNASHSIDLFLLSGGISPLKVLLLLFQICYIRVLINHELHGIFYL